MRIDWFFQNSSSTDTTVAEFFGSLSVATRHFFDDDDKNDRTSSSEKNWQPTTSAATPTSINGDADVGFRSKYSTLPSKKTFSSRSSTSSSRSRLRQPQPQVSSVRLSSFGAEKVCPIVAKDEDLTHAELYVSSLKLITHFKALVERSLLV